MDSIKRKAVLQGITPIMFDRYAGDNKTQLLPEQKMYLDENNGLLLPSQNLHSFLSAINTPSAVKAFYPSKEYKKVAQVLLGYVQIEPFNIPIKRHGKQIMWEGWDKNGISLHKSVARVKNGVPNPKERPVVDSPWTIEFNITIWNNGEVSETEVKNLFLKGGVPIGLGTYRGVYGKFCLESWEKA